jgi:hypothetical protein
MKVCPIALPAFRWIVTSACLLGATLSTMRADAVTDWNTAFENNLLVPAERGPRVPVRTLAIMHAAMFDAVNGIERKYEPLFVTDGAPAGAQAEAAAIQAAFTTLSALRPGSQAAWDAQLAASLATLPGHPGAAQSIARGRAWGATVANAIIAWRAADGSTTVLPPFVGSTAAGYWRHTPLGASPTAGYANLATAPFALDDPLAFDPGPPYGFVSRADAIASAAYAADVNEVKARGGLTSAVRTAAELDEALFLDACDVAGLNRLLRSLLRSHDRLVDNARTFALFNMTAFDATIVFFRIKYQHALWRPFQAIRYADEDNNAATVPDAAWTSYLPTPPHPEYISAHVTLFTALLRVVARLEGDCHAVELTAAASAVYPGGTKTYESLDVISDAAVNARVNVGFHFRETGEISQVLGREIGDYMVENSLEPRGRRGHRHCGR